MKDSQIIVVLALLQLSLGLPFESSQQTEVAANSEFDNASLDAAASPQPQLSGQYVDGSQVEGAQAAAGGPNPDAGVAQAASGGVKANQSGPILVGAQAQPQVPAVGEEQAFGGGAQAVGGANVSGGEQAYLSGQTNGGAQGQLSGLTVGGPQAAAGGSLAAAEGAKADAGGSLAVAGGTKADAGGAQAAAVGAQAYLSGQAIVGVQAQSQGPVVGGAQAAAAGATGAQAVVGDKVTAGGTPAGDVGPQAVGGQQAGTGGAQTYLLGQNNGVPATVGGAATAGGGQANSRAQEGAQAASSQSSTGTASDSLAPSPALQLPQGGLQVSRSESSSGQISKQTQAQVIGGATTSNLTINAAGSSSGVSKGSVGQTKGIQAGFEVIT